LLTLSWAWSECFPSLWSLAPMAPSLLALWIDAKKTFFATLSICMIWRMRYLNMRYGRRKPLNGHQVSQVESQYYCRSESASIGGPALLAREAGEEGARVGVGVSANVPS
jgi:hypothetical protein